MAGIVAREMLQGHGELRAYDLADRSELLLEVLREADGRAWQLRLPLEHGAVVINLLAGATPLLGSTDAIAFGADGTALLGDAPLDAGTRLAAVALLEGEERAFALWRRERTQSGWSWTIDLALVPMEFAVQLCTFVRGALARTGSPVWALG